MRPRILWQAAGVRAAIYRLHRPGLEPTRDESLHVALALVRNVEVPGRDLRSLRRVFARRKSVAQPGERSGPRPLSGDQRRHSEHAGRRRRIDVDRDALRRSDVRARAETFALGRTRIRRAGARGAAGSGAETPGRLRRNSRRMGQHDREIARGARRNRRRDQRRSARSALDRAVGPRRDRGIGRADRATRRCAGRQRELQRRPDDHRASGRVAGNLERAARAADRGEQAQRDDRLQSDLRIRRAA